MSSLSHSPFSFSHPSSIQSAAGRTAAFTQNRISKGLAAVLLAALVSALLVVADSVVHTYADGHLLLGWICLWAVGFAAIGLLANTARRTSARVIHLVSTAGLRRDHKQADAYLLALARHDPRIMAEVQAAIQRADDAAQTVDQERVQAWVERHPLGTFNAAYQFPGKRGVFQTTPLSGLPTHLQYLPG
jgi:hypothetical protein